MAATVDSSVTLPSGEAIAALGQGTWRFAERPERRASEIMSLRLGIELGMTVIDTAEMYADGAAEVLVGEAIAGHRDEVFLVSKVLPHHATRRGTVLACQASLRRLGTDHLDLYLLHWRGPEYDLLPWCRAHGIPIMAYSPLEQGRILRHPALIGVARRHRATPAQVALAWVLRFEGVNAIPAAGPPADVRENAAAADLQLRTADMAVLDAAFPPPQRKVPLEVL